MCHHKPIAIAVTDSSHPRERVIYDQGFRSARPYPKTGVNFSCSPIYLGKVTPNTFCMPPNILVIDDDIWLVDILIQFLEIYGLRAKGFHSGIAALEWFDKNWRDIDLIFSDIMMPAIGGYELLLRLQEIDPGVRVVFSSGMNDRFTVSTLLENGALGFFEKPLEYSDLIRWSIEFLGFYGRWSQYQLLLDE